MIDAVRGEIMEVGGDFVCMEVNGLTFRIHCPAETLRACHDRVIDQLFTHFVVREDSFQLYGFVERSDRELFGKLLTVGQVGPKLALQILSSLPGGTLIEAIRANDVARLTTVKGIGQKTAQRILIDLRDKIGAGAAASSDLFLSPDEETAIQALTSKALGFSAREARKAVVQLRGEALSAEELVREALTLLGPRR